MIPRNINFLPHTPGGGGLGGGGEVVGGGGLGGGGLSAGNNGRWTSPDATVIPGY